jgi:hypothetical protein
MKNTKQSMIDPRCANCPIAVILNMAIDINKSSRKTFLEVHFEKKISRPGTLHKIASMKNYQLN